jgi:uncharacterized membrane protein YcaP (DUF421 family)
MELTVWHSIFVLQAPVVEKLLRTILVYATVVLLFRLTGKRGLASLNTLDFVVLFLLSNVVQNAVIGNDNSFSGGAIGAVTLVAVNAALNRAVVASPTVARWLEGTPTTVIAHGAPLMHDIRRIGLRTADLDHAVKLQNGDTIGDVALGVLDPGGHLILDLEPSQRGATREDIERVLSRIASFERRVASSG